MKVGIVTVHSVPNYGAILQAYALADYLKSQGIDATTIDYRQPALAELYRFRWKSPPPLWHWLRLQRSERFVQSHLPLSRSRFNSLDEFLPATGGYDAFITGSDQVWFTGPVQYFDPMFFLSFPAPGQRKISYAASAGGTAAFGEFEERARHALSGFHRVGVRDSHTATLVAPLAPHPPVEVVDPVFLCDFRRILSPRRRAIPPYLLVFGDFTGKAEAILREVIEATGLTNVISLQYPCRAAVRRIPAPGPPEWLRWFRDAAFVVTSYFHGTAMAVKFRRPFLSVPTPGRRIKVRTLLDDLGLARRCLPCRPGPEEAASLAATPVDWTTADRQLAGKIALSQAFLREALG